MNDFAQFLNDQLDYSHTRLMTTLEGLTDEQAFQRLSPESNSIAAIMLHLGRVEDLHTARAILSTTQVWDKNALQQKMGIPSPTEFPVELGWSLDQGHDPGLRLADLLAYLEETRGNTKAFLQSATDKDLTTPVDDGLERHAGWTAAKHIAHLGLHQSHHQGQVDYVKGLINVFAKA
jgi:uncharacterized damage-inducible protein DinB